MSKEKQIEEMAKIFADVRDQYPCRNRSCAECPYFKVDSSYCEDCHNMEALYNAGYRKQEWISVDERLPDVCGMDVLMVAVNCYGHINIIKGFTDYQCPIAFRTTEKQYDGIWGAWDVTHWMPLPEPPNMK